MNKEDALYFQRKMRPCAEKAQKDAEEIFQEFKKGLPKIYEMIPNDTLGHKIERLLYRMI
jgi:hypothetical protein